MTITEVSSEVADLEATSFNETTLVITWRLPANPNANILGYFISITDITGDTIIRLENITSTSLTQTNLGNVYEWNADGLYELNF